jgi:hypothetical protein
VQEGKGTSAVVSAPGRRLSTWEAVIGMKVMMSGWRLNYCNLDSFGGEKKGDFVAFLC